ncbi:MAG: hypothetical protein HC837_13535 [Chloroflexaceae bacterium]|nr:hypothetical protein [Chloroflexaceae bacterium]
MITETLEKLERIHKEVYSFSDIRSFRAAGGGDHFRSQVRQALAGVRVKDLLVLCRHLKQPAIGNKERLIERIEWYCVTAQANSLAILGVDVDLG